MKRALTYARDAKLEQNRFQVVLCLKCRSSTQEIRYSEMSSVLFAYKPYMYRVLRWTSTSKESHAKTWAAGSISAARILRVVGKRWR